MKSVRILAGLALLLLLVQTAAAARPAAPDAGCSAGATYDPACDVNHDGWINVQDVQLAASRWGSQGTWAIDAHDHWGETWSGSGTGLNLQSTSGASGVLRLTAGNTGLRIDSAGTDGVFVYQVGNPGILQTSSNKNGFELAGAEGHGLYVGRANMDGVIVNWTGGHGLHVGTAALNGVQIDSAAYDGLKIVSTTGDGIEMSSTGGHGVYVVSAGLHAIQVDAADYNGVNILNPAKDGVYVQRTGGAAAIAANAGNHGFEVGHAAASGLYVGQADQSGVVVNSAGGDGVYVSSAGGDGVYVLDAAHDGVHVEVAGSPSTWPGSDLDNGFEVAGAGGHGLYAGRTEHSGVYINSAGQNGFHVGSAGSHGLSVGSAGYSGVYVEDGDSYGVLAYSDSIGVAGDTRRGDHEWGVATDDKIYAGTAIASGGPVMLVAQSGDDAGLETGDVVSVVGLGTIPGEGEAPPPLVKRAGAGAVMGVVYRRLVVEREVQAVAGDGSADRPTRFAAHSTADPIAPGDYLFVVVLGPAQVRAVAGDGLQPGDLLSPAASGRAARAAPVKAGDAIFYAPGTVIGQAMSGLEAGQGDGLIWALVMPR